MMFDENKFIYSVVKILNKLKIPSEKIHLQKFVSYLSDTMNNVPFNFSIYTYGPFCKDLSAKLGTLVAWGDLKYINKSYLLPEDISNFLELSEENFMTEKLQNFIDVIPRLDFNNMELYGTMHYYISRTKPVNKDIIIKKFKTAKNKFDDTEINECFEKLITLN